ncbi:hypothetical protein [Streptomyces sp. GC420]|uniref:hypothetical protein n=1 Tax=Streptomyces sp. GC420 TaxID=2697568 RepID=UPI0014150331|nr:hypothetical protein [Streptomyces sp. GC420]NBM17236.1 hypothetical protein [Streptomyces sp. GC420]
MTAVKRTAAEQPPVERLRTLPAEGRPMKEPQAAAAPPAGPTAGEASVHAPAPLAVPDRPHPTTNLETQG